MLREKSSSLRPLLLAAALVAVLLTAGCASRRATTATEALVGCTNERPLHVVVLATLWESSPAKVAASLRAAFAQLRPVVTAPGDTGTPGLLLSVYGLSERSFAAGPRRLRLDCVPPLPPRQEPSKLGAGDDRVKVARQFQTAHQRATSARVRAEQTFDSFTAEVQRAAWPSQAPSIWGGLIAASKEFATVEAERRYVVIVARDESHVEGRDASTYCLPCTDLKRAVLVFLGFDHPTPAKQRERAWGWSCWASEAGAERTLTFRGDDLLPPLFGASPPAASWAREELLGRGCRR